VLLLNEFYYCKNILRYRHSPETFGYTLVLFMKQEQGHLSGTAMSHGLDDRGSFPGRAGNFSLHHHVQTGSGAHAASYAMGNRSSFPRGKAASM
jgi:hypothetical protein